MLKIALTQLMSGTDKAVNIASARRSIARAKGQGADVIAFPEFHMAFSPASQSAAELSAAAEAIDGPFVGFLAAAAASASIHVVTNIYEPSPVADRVYDSSIWIDSSGKIASVYRKLHLYDAFGFKESDKFHPGGDIAPLVGVGDLRFGMMICYDLRFPEMARMLALEGAHVLVAPSGWVHGDLKVDHWQTMIKARALENGCYVVAPGQVGHIYIGHSMAVDPLGRVLADLGESEGMAVIDVDLNLVAETREKLPLLKNRRADVYAQRQKTA